MALLLLRILLAMGMLALRF